MTDSAAQRYPLRHAVADGVTMLAVALLLVVGALAILRGIMGVAGNEIFGRAPQYSFSLGSATWGWIFLGLGVLAVVMAVGLILGAVWARVLAMLVAAVSIVANFLALPHYPAWSVLVIGIDIVVIWAVANQRLELP